MVARLGLSEAEVTALADAAAQERRTARADAESTAMEQYEEAAQLRHQKSAPAKVGERNLRADGDGARKRQRVEQACFCEPSCCVLGVTHALCRNTRTSKYHSHTAWTHLIHRLYPQSRPSRIGLIPLHGRDQHPQHRVNLLQVSMHRCLVVLRSLHSRLQSLQPAVDQHRLDVGRARRLRPRVLVEDFASGRQPEPNRNTEAYDLVGSVQSMF